MSKLKGKIEILFSLDTSEYPVPADNRLSLQLKEDIQEAVESSVDITINNIKITGLVKKNDTEQDFDQD